MAHWRYQGINPNNWNEVNAADTAEQYGSGSACGGIGRPATFEDIAEKDKENAKKIDTLHQINDEGPYLLFESKDSAVCLPFSIKVVSWATLIATEEDGIPVWSVYSKYTDLEPTTRWEYSPFFHRPRDASEGTPWRMTRKTYDIDLSH